MPPPIARFLKAANVQLGMAHGHLDDIDPEKDLEAEKRRLKNEVVEEIVDLFLRVTVSPEPGASPVIANRKRFREDFLKRESQGGVAIGYGIALPHVRSPQTRQFAMVFARSREGVWYDAPDGKPVHLFFGICAPPWEQEWYLAFNQWIGRTFRAHLDWLPDALLAAETADDIVGLLVGLDD